MLGASQLIITAYVHDGEILCVKCGDKEEIPTEHAVCAYNMDSDFSEDGAYCERCGHEIVAPPEPEPEDDPEEATQMLLSDVVRDAVKTTFNADDSTNEDGYTFGGFTK